MPEVATPPRRRVAASLSGLLLASTAACSFGSSHEFAGTRLDNPYQVPEIALTDTAGASYSLTEDTEKRLTLVFFGYTHCPDYCPAVMGSIAAAMNRLSERDRRQVDVVFVTTDPERDDPSALRSYLDGYDKEFIGLTGRLGDIVELGVPLAIYVADGKKLPSGGYDLGGHTTVTLGISEKDEAVVLWKQGTSAVEFAADIHALLTDGG